MNVLSGVRAKALKKRSKQQ